MKSFIFLVVNLSVSSAFLINPNGPNIVEIGEDKDITDANKDLMEDDIMEPPDTHRSAIVNPRRLWTSPVPYVLDSSLEMNARGVIMRAFEQFRLKTCIDFKPRASEEYYISVQKLGGCFSYIGMVQPNGQDLSIGSRCDEISTVEHEFLHALGFYHEQSRYDRDDFVTIKFENIQQGFERNFNKVRKEQSTTNGVAYDYWSVMHYGKNAFSNGNGSTMITKNPNFKDIIGQRFDVSPRDVLELNLLYECNSSVAFKMYCGFSNKSMCHMSRCSQRGRGWEMVTRAVGGPSSDHTTLHSDSDSHHGHDDSFFMHVSTASGEEGDTAQLETPRMHSKRDCETKCLQFYYFHSGHESDQLNIWVRDFKSERDSKGARRLIGQITGPRTSHWKLHHVSLRTSQHFQVEFEVRKGSGKSSGGISIDDINLSETECPHVMIQIDDFEKLLNTSKYGTTIYSPRQYSSGGYAYGVGVILRRPYVGLFVQLMSGKYDKELQWPVPNRQVTFQMVDQQPQIQMQMSKQRSITSDLSVSSSDGSYLWGNPREVGTPTSGENNETIFVGPSLGRSFFTSLEEMKYRQFLKGGSIVFAFNFQDLTPLVKGNSLPCPRVEPVKVDPSSGWDKRPCSTQILPSTTMPPSTTFSPFPPRTTDDGSIFGFSPAMVASPVLTLLLTVMLLLR
ncbi:uncharacterized protein V6R79_015146 [Siganus canaliculatus]